MQQTDNRLNNMGVEATILTGLACQFISISISPLKHGPCILFKATEC